VTVVIDKYILDGKRPVRCDDVLAWGRWFETADVHVAETTVDGVRVSTVFLGIGGWRGPPQLFETMIFGGEHDMDQWRYATWEEAVAGHAEAVKLVQAASAPVIV
jgi:hypothetical protein